VYCKHEDIFLKEILWANSLRKHLKENFENSMMTLKIIRFFYIWKISC